MKKNYPYFLIAALLIVVGSCKKKLAEHHGYGENNIKNNSRITTTDGRLVFETIEEFDSVVNVLSAMYIDSLPLAIIDSLVNWEYQYSYTSLRRYVNNDSSLLPGKDFILGTLLNSRSIIQIQGYIFKILHDDTLLYSLNVDSMSASDYTSLIEGNYASSQRIMQHSYNEDVFETLGLWGWGCGESNRSSTSPIYYYTPEIYIQQNIGYRIEIGYKYSNIGFYSKLMIQYALQYKYGTNPWKYFSVSQDQNYMPTNYSLKIHEEYSLRKEKCKVCESSYFTNAYTSKSTIKKYLHYSTVGLHYYYVKSSVSLHIGSTYTNPATFSEFESWKQYSSPWNPCQ